MNLFLKIVDYARTLLAPFFYIALYRYRQRIIWAAFILVSLLYVQYLVDGTVGRGSAVMILMLLGLSIWIPRPRYRWALVVGTLVLIPLVLMASYAFSITRIGGTVSDFTLMKAAGTILEQETSFPRKVGMPIIEAGARVDLFDYAKWIITLPVPKVLIGEIEGARINYEISDIVLGGRRGERVWYIVLPGLVAESVYIYGPYFFWLHGVFIAFLAALMMRVMEGTPQLLFLKAFLVLQFGYVLNRAGIAALLPVIVNHFLLFYVYAFVVIFVLFRKVQKARCKAMC